MAEKLKKKPSFFSLKSFKGHKDGNVSPRTPTTPNGQETQFFRAHMTNKYAQSQETKNRRWVGYPINLTDCVTTRSWLVFPIYHHHKLAESRPLLETGCRQGLPNRSVLISVHRLPTKTIGARFFCKGFYIMLLAKDVQTLGPRIQFALGRFFFSLHPVDWG